MLEFNSFISQVSIFLLIFLSVCVLSRCIRSLLRVKSEPEIWAYIRSGKETLPVYHWENIIGRSRSADVRIKKPGIHGVHAVIKRSDSGKWTLYDIFSRGEVWVNGDEPGPDGIALVTNDVIKLGSNTVKFIDITPEKRQKLEAQRTSAAHAVNPSITLFELTIIQLVLLVEHLLSARIEYVIGIFLAFIVTIMLEWVCFNAMRVMGRSGYEVETIAFYLTTFGLSIAATSTPQDMYKQTLLIVLAVTLFLLFGLWMRGVNRTAASRVPAAILALGLLAVNVVGGSILNGARNWMIIGGYSIQPSEIVKVLYIAVGASTLDMLYRRRNLFSFICYSAACVIALAFIGDFGTALVFFIAFLVISFMRSGSIATVFLAISGAAMAGFLAVSVKPYIAQRFAMWRHVWEDPWDKGYQQTHALSAAAAGGLFGKGAGNGWLKKVAAANTDMVFCMISEEHGLIIACLMVISLLVLAFFVIKSCRNARSSYYSIASCAVMAMLLSQMALNVFGALDILPFTGVTFPFVSRGGTSLISCWMMMAFIKGNDTRKDGSFAVRPLRDLLPQPRKGGRKK